MVPLNTENYEELLSTNEHSMVLNDPGVIENSESSAIENVSSRNAESLIVHNSSPIKTGKKRRLNEVNWKANVNKQLRNTGKAYKSTKSKKIVPSRAFKPSCKDKCKFQCGSKFTQEQRQTILNDYWRLGAIEK
jgi:hypothetical protein